MAEILVRAVDNTLPDPSRSERECYKRGDLVLVEEDGFIWSRQESKAQWVAEGLAAKDWPGRVSILKIPGVPAEKLRAFIGPQGTDTAMIRKSLYRLVIDELRASEKQQLGKNGDLTLSKTDATLVIRSKLDEREIVI